LKLYSLPMKVLSRPKLIPFPKHGDSQQNHGRSLLGYLRILVSECLGRLLNRLGVAGAVKPMKISDSLTGQKMEIRVGLLFTRISVNGRDYYFNRLSGRFDGTGMGCR